MPCKYKALHTKTLEEVGFGLCLCLKLFTFYCHLFYSKLMFVKLLRPDAIQYIIYRVISSITRDSISIILRFCPGGKRGSKG